MLVRKMDKKVIIGLIIFFVIVGTYFTKTQIDISKKYPNRFEDKPNYDVWQSISYNIDISIRNIQFAGFFVLISLLINIARLIPTKILKPSKARSHN